MRSSSGCTTTVWSARAFATSARLAMGSSFLCSTTEPWTFGTSSPFRRTGRASRRSSEPHPLGVGRRPEQALPLPTRSSPETASAAPPPGRRRQIDQVRRYAPFFLSLREIVAAGRRGAVGSVDWRENLVYWPFAHSYVRGNWGT